MPLVSARIVARVVPDAISGIAFAGPDQSVLCASIVQLQGSIVGDDPANHTFEWEQTDGTPVILINANTLTPSFVNPQLSDLVFTLYVDRNTPYEDSDTITVSRAPQGKVTVPGGSEGMQGRTGTGVALTTSSSANVRGSNTELLVTDPFVTGWGWKNPPTARYSPIFKADDLQRIRNNLTGQYWLMNDIDLTGYDWEPIGTPQRPFRGELQGNRFSIQNLTIETTPIEQQSSDADFSNVVLLVDFDGVDEATSETDESNSAHALTFNGTTKLDNVRGAKRSGQTTSLLCNGGSSDNVTIAATSDFDFSTDDFTIECDVYFDNALNSENNEILTTNTVSTGWGLGKISGGTHGNMRFRFGSNSFNSSLDSLTPAASTWHTMAVSRVGSNVYLFFNGTLLSTNNIGAAAPTAGARSLYIGTNSAITFDEMDGAIGNVRITKGVGRYTSTYTPSTDPFSSITYKPVGLFSHIGNGAVIEQVGITNASITNANSSIYKGILAGSAQGPSTDDGGTVTIRDVYVEGTIASGGNQAGGLIGHTGANASSVYENTYSDVTITGGGTSVGGWAGYFDTTATYINNYWNSTKTASGVGTDGDSPIAGELDARTSAQLNAQANYTNWDFTTTWEIDEGVSPATLQQETTHIRSGGFCDDQYMIAWDIPSKVGSRLYPPTYYYKGAIVEERLSTGGWGYPRFIPRERIGALMTPDTSHRITAIWQYYPHTDSVKLRTEINRESQPTMSKEVAVLDHRLFTSKNTSSWFGPYGIDAYATGGGSEGMTTNLVINIQNPRKITLLVNSPSAYAGGTGAFTEVESAYYIRRLSGRAEAFTEPAAAYGGGTFANVVTSTITITRANGASIGGGP